jgi:transcriptional regulator with XRE-family HTH domain
VTDIPQGPAGYNRLPPLPGESDPDAVFAQCLRAARAAAGLTQRQIADLMTGAGYQMHQTTIAKIESGERPVILGEAVALARIVGADLADLIDGPAEGNQLAVALAELAGHQRNVEALEGRAARAAVDAQDAQAALDAARTQLENARWHAEGLRRITNQGE